MNLPMNHKPLNPAEDRLLDRLVDGELGEVERRELLLRLESEPGGWRRCALANGHHFVIDLDVIRVGRWQLHLTGTQP
jgi:hypothetical protein